jgi:hypothetical protein
MASESVAERDRWVTRIREVLNKEITPRDIARKPFSRLMFSLRCQLVMSVSSIFHGQFSAALRSQFIRLHTSEQM